MGDKPIDIAGIKATCSNIKDQSSCASNSNCEWGSTINFDKLENSIINPIKYCLEATDLSINFTDLEIPPITPTCKYTGTGKPIFINCDLILSFVQKEIKKYNSEIQTDLQNFLQSQSKPAKAGQASPDSYISDEILTALNIEFAKISTASASTLSTVVSKTNCYEWDGSWWQSNKCRDGTTTVPGANGGCLPTAASKAMGKPNSYDTPCGAANNGPPPGGLGVCTACPAPGPTPLAPGPAPLGPPPNPSCFAWNNKWYMPSICGPNKAGKTGPTVPGNIPKVSGCNKFGWLSGTGCGAQQCVKCSAGPVPSPPTPPSPSPTECSQNYHHSAGNPKNPCVPNCIPGSCPSHVPFCDPSGICKSGPAQKKTQCYFWKGKWWEPNKCRDGTTTVSGLQGGCLPTAASKAMGKPNSYNTLCGAANNGLPPIGLGLCTPCQEVVQNCENIPSNPINPIPTTCNIPSIIESFFTEFEPIFIEILNSEVQTQMLANFPMTVDLSDQPGIKIQAVACSNWLYPKTLSINNVPSNCGVDETSYVDCGSISGPAQVTLDNISLQIGAITWTPVTEVPFTLSLTAALEPINIDATMKLDVHRVTEMPGPIQANCIGECAGGPGENCCGNGGCCAYVLLGQDQTERTAPYIAASIPITVNGTFKLKNQTDLKNLGACVSIDSLDLSLKPKFSVTSGQFAFKVSGCKSALVGASAWVFDYVIANKMSWWQDLITNILGVTPGKKGQHPLITGPKLLPLLQSALSSFKC